MIIISAIGVFLDVMIPFLQNLAAFHVENAHFFGENIYKIST
jgi:hypothetical protein